MKWANVSRDAIIGEKSKHSSNCQLLVLLDDILGSRKNVHGTNQRTNRNESDERMTVIR